MTLWRHHDNVRRKKNNHDDDENVISAGKKKEAHSETRMNPTEKHEAPPKKMKLSLKKKEKELRGK